MNYRFIFLIMFFFSCNNEKSDSKNLKYNKACENFLKDLYDSKIDRVLGMMDQSLFSPNDKDKMFTSLIAVSKKLQENYKSQVHIEFVTYEAIIHEALPAAFLIFKIESSTNLGYYYFYINESNGKILLVSEFGRIKQKRL